MATNDLNQKINNEVFHGDNGKEMQLLKKRVEIIELILSKLNPNLSNKDKDKIKVLEEEYTPFENKIKEVKKNRK